MSAKTRTLTQEGLDVGDPTYSSRCLTALATGEPFFINPLTALHLNQLSHAFLWMGVI